MWTCMRGDQTACRAHVHDAAFHLKKGKPITGDAMRSLRDQGTWWVPSLFNFEMAKEDYRRFHAGPRARTARGD